MRDTSVERAGSRTDASAGTRPAWALSQGQPFPGFSFMRDHGNVRRRRRSAGVGARTRWSASPARSGRPRGRRRRRCDPLRRPAARPARPPASGCWHRNSRPLSPDRRGLPRTWPFGRPGRAARWPAGRCSNTLRRSSSSAGVSRSSRNVANPARGSRSATIGIARAEPSAAAAMGKDDDAPARLPARPGDPSSPSGLRSRHGLRFAGGASRSWRASVSFLSRHVGGRPGRDTAPSAGATRGPPHARNTPGLAARPEGGPWGGRAPRAAGEPAAGHGPVLLAARRNARCRSTGICSSSASSTSVRSRRAVLGLAETVRPGIAPN